MLPVPGGSRSSGGEVMAGSHIYTAPKLRVRQRCPFHKRLCYGDKQEFYDTTRVYFDCGTVADYGYDEWTAPRSVQRRKWREAKRRQRATP